MHQYAHRNSESHRTAEDGPGELFHAQITARRDLRVEQARTDAYELLRSCDEQRASELARSLHPERNSPSPLEEIARRLLPRVHDPQLIEEFAKGLASFACTLDEHFPFNIFSDLDFLAAESLRRATLDSAPANYLRYSYSLLVETLENTGVHSAVRYPFVHDLILGFDWARWVKRDPTARSFSSPYGHRFLRHIARRATELNQEYSQTETQDYRKQGGFRNSFPFDRSPVNEMTLFLRLRTFSRLPIKAWAMEARLRPGVDYDQFRMLCADRLGLMRRSA